MRYTFDAYLLDTACYELYRAGTRVPLRPKALEVLAYLVVHHDRVVSKQELLAQLWPDHVVGEDGLKVYIMAVRQALGERSRLLQTVRGCGYRLVTPVTVADAPPVHLPPSRPLLAPVQDHAEPATITPLARHSHCKRHDRPDAPAVWPWSWLLVCLSQVGAFAEGQAMRADVLRLAEALEHPFSLAVAAFGVGQLSLRQGDLSQAIAVFERGLAMCQSHDLRDWLPTLAARLGYTYALAGRLPEALTLLRQAIRQGEVMSGGALEAAFVIWLGEAYLRAGRLDEAWTQGQRALEFSRAHQERGNAAYALRLLGEVAAQRHPPPGERAEAHYRQALALAEELGMRPLTAHCHQGRGVLYVATGQRAQAHTALLTAIALYRDMEMSFWLPQAESTLARVSGPTVESLTEAAGVVLPDTGFEVQSRTGRVLRLPIARALCGRGIPDAWEVL